MPKSGEMRVVEIDCLPELKQKVINSAYRKLKSYVYEDNALLHLRITLVEFESNGDIKVKLNSIVKLLELNDIDQYLVKISFLVLPKKISDTKASVENAPILSQVNDAKYGDSRITQPSKTEEMDMAKIKGGEDVVLLASTLDVRNLREFQKLSHIVQEEWSKTKSKTSYKFTPPKFLEQCNNGRLV
jgi:hypothetical protein